MFMRYSPFSRCLFISSFPILSLLNLALVLSSTTVDLANSLVTLLLALNWKFQGKRLSCRLTLGTLGELFFKHSRKGTNSEIHMCTANALNPFPHLPNFLPWPTARNRFYIIILHTNIKYNWNQLHEIVLTLIKTKLISYTKMGCSRSLKNSALEIRV